MNTVPSTVTVWGILQGAVQEIKKLRQSAPEVRIVEPTEDEPLRHLLCPVCGTSPEVWFDLEVDTRQFDGEMVREPNVVNLVGVSVTFESGSNGEAEVLSHACGNCDSLVRFGPDITVMWG